MSVMDRPALVSYLVAMASAMFRLLALVALMLMPLGMGTAPALAAQGHHAMAAAGSDHCDEQQDRDEAPNQKQMDCTAACTALTVPSAPLLAPQPGPTAPRIIGVATPFTGIEPEIATPPPKSI